MKKNNLVSRVTKNIDEFNLSIFFGGVFQDLTAVSRETGVVLQKIIFSGLFDGFALNT
ncbi:hypothetical protein KIM322_15040 [Lactobacillus xylocopicola]|uniref:Uncharacterized protein n=1 Tax=Lactobacillus xylocopicola TaxID=2976676 RepID=A0ABN6SN90_9LACO|nr:hypothetical protein KIM322_15040 [Lactobacillus xylocopicola]